jgi:FkbM family methyltransferase
MTFFPLPDVSDLKQSFINRVAALRQDAVSYLPLWARAEGPALLKQRKFIICGARCASEIRVLARHADVLAIVDDAQAGKKIFGIPVIDTDAWISRVRGNASIVSCILILGDDEYNYFLRHCMQWGFNYFNPFHLMCLFKDNQIDTGNEHGNLFVYGYDFYSYTLQNAERLIKLADHLGDAFSQYSWFCMLLYRLTLNPFYLKSCAVGLGHASYTYDGYITNRQFFNLTEDEVYIDGGAFDGDTIERFIHSVQGKFRHIYSFEPTHAHNLAIRKRLAALQYAYLPIFKNKITLIEKGMWDCDTILKFNPNRGVDIFETGAAIHTNSGHFLDTDISSGVYERDMEERAAIEVPVTTIDAATNQDASFIKFEVEGAELKALHGATQTLQKMRPKIALSIYHKPDDYVALMEFMLNCDLGYQFGFRQHKASVPDATVLYCYHE